MNILLWIKKELGILGLENSVRHLKTEVEFMQAAIDANERFIARKLASLKDYIHTDVDVGVRGNNTIILTGVYRNRGFVRFYDLGEDEFASMVARLKDMQDHTLIRHIDKPYGMSSGLFELQ